MQCPFCHAALPPNGKFCRACGKPLTKTCTQCGKLNSIAARFCAGCGHTFSNSTVNGESTENAGLTPYLSQKTTRNIPHTTQIAPQASHALQSAGPDRAAPSQELLPANAPQPTENQRLSEPGSTPQAKAATPLTSPMAPPVAPKVAPAEPLVEPAAAAIPGRTSSIPSAVAAPRTTPPPSPAASPARPTPPAPPLASHDKVALQAAAHPAPGSTPAPRINAASATPAAGQAGRPKWIIPTAAAAVLAIAAGITAWWWVGRDGGAVIQPGNPPSPVQVEAQPAVSADKDALAREAVVAWLETLKQGDFSAHLRIVDFPYLASGTVVEGPDQYRRVSNWDDRDPVLRQMVHQIQQSYPPQAIDATIAGRVDPDLVRRFIGKDGKLIRVGVRTQNGEQDTLLFAVRITEAGAKVVGVWEHSNAPVGSTAEAPYPAGEAPAPPPQTPKVATIQRTPQVQAPMQREAQVPPPTAAPVARSPEKPKGIRELLLGRWRTEGGIIEYRPDGSTQGYRGDGSPLNSGWWRLEGDRLTIGWEKNGRRHEAGCTVLGVNDKELLCQNEREVQRATRLGLGEDQAPRHVERQSQPVAQDRKNQGANAIEQFFNRELEKLKRCEGKWGKTPECPAGTWNEE